MNECSLFLAERALPLYIYFGAVCSLKQGRTVQASSTTCVIQA